MTKYNAFSMCVMCMPHEFIYKMSNVFIVHYTLYKSFTESVSLFLISEKERMWEVLQEKYQRIHERLVARNGKIFFCVCVCVGLITF